jgi:hypothetical protein
MEMFALLGGAIVSRFLRVTRLLGLIWLSAPLNRPTDEPRSVVRVLATEDELNEAVERAITFERAVMESAQRRIQRYAQERNVVPVMQVPLELESRTEPEKTAPSFSDALDLRLQFSTRSDDN